jgi:hypothetical protein
LQEIELTFLSLSGTGTNTTMNGVWSSLAGSGSFTGTKGG